MSAPLNAALRQHPQTREALDVPGGFTIDDFGQLPDGVQPPADVVRQAQAWSALLTARHQAGEHHMGIDGGWHLYCPLCRDYAIGSLHAALTRDRRFDPTRRSWDGTVTWAEGHTSRLNQSTGCFEDVFAEHARSPFYSYDDLANLPEPEWLVEGVIPQGGIGYITGRDGSYKTFLAVDLMTSIVTWTSGEGWHAGRGVEVGGWGRVLVLEGEGIGSFRKRIDAATQSRGLDLTSTQKSSIVVRNGTVNLYGGNGDFHGLLDFARDFQPDLVVVDTLNRSAGAADQNSASDMSVITQRLQALAQAAESKAEHGERCTVIVVAHTGKSDEDTRGSSAIEDDADFVLHCKKVDDRLRVKVAKQKDGESGFTIDLRAMPVGESLALVDAVDVPAGLIDPVRTRRLDLARRIRDELERHPGLSQAKVAEAIKGRKQDIAEALGWMIDEGYVAAEPGTRGAHHHSLTDKPLTVGEVALNLDGLGGSE